MNTKTVAAFEAPHNRSPDTDAELAPVQLTASPNAPFIH